MAVHPSETKQPVVTTTDRARAGVTGHNVRYVLLFGILAVAVIFAGLWVYHFAS